MTDDEEKAAAHAEAIAQQWGEPFRKLALDDRFEFEGDAIFIRLWKPIFKDGVKQERLEFAEPSLAQMKAMDAVAGEMAKVTKLLMQVAVMTEKEAGALGMRDLGSVGRLLDAFSAAARVTGA